MKRTPLKRKTPMKRGPWKHPAKAIIGIKLNAADLRLWKPKRKALAKMSPKMKILRRIYLRLKATFLERHPRCQFVTEGGTRCRHASTDLHHKRGRGIWLLIIEFFMATCRYHHDWIHAHPNQARKLGYLI